jgi:hypothetical protein
MVLQNGRSTPLNELYPEPKSPVTADATE